MKDVALPKPSISPSTTVITPQQAKKFVYLSAQTQGAFGRPVKIDPQAGLYSVKASGFRVNVTKSNDVAVSSSKACINGAANNVENAATFLNLLKQVQGIYGAGKK